MSVTNRTNRRRSARSNSRADSVRRRRSRQTGGVDRRRTRRRKTLRAPTVPPMVARRGKIGAVNGKDRSKSGRARKRFDVALGIPGAELRLPAVPGVRFGWRFLSGFLVVLSLGLLYTLWNSPIYLVNSAEVFGIQRLTPQEVNTVLNVAGTTVFAVESRRLAQELQEAFPELYAISIAVRFPAEVVVSVEERQPVLAWQQNGLTLWVDENGVAFPPRGEAEIQVTVEGLDAPEVPVAIDDTVEIFMNPAFIPAILSVSEKAPAGTTLLYDRRHGLGWNDPKGWQVFMGRDVTDMDEKLRVYAVLVEKLNADGVVPALINMEQVDAPYFRMAR